MVMVKYVSDLLYGFALFVNAALFIPQAWKIYVKKSAAGSSLITFAGFNMVQFLGFINGIYNVDYALIFGQAVSMVACGLVTVQLARYKFKAFQEARCQND
jgi:MtN3 and saliva related transmembrane protein